MPALPRVLGLLVVGALTLPLPAQAAQSNFVTIDVSQTESTPSGIGPTINTAIDPNTGAPWTSIDYTYPRAGPVTVNLTAQWASSQGTSFLTFDTSSRTSERELHALNSVSGYLDTYMYFPGPGCTIFCGAPSIVPWWSIDLKSVVGASFEDVLVIDSGVSTFALTFKLEGNRDLVIGPANNNPTTGAYRLLETNVRVDFNGVIDGQTFRLHNGDYGFGSAGGPYPGLTTDSHLPESMILSTPRMPVIAGGNVIAAGLMLTNVFEAINLDNGNIQIDLSNDYSNTATLVGIELFDANGMPVTTATISSQLGWNYPILGGAPASVPEPTTPWLLAACGVAAFARRRRK